MKTVLKTAAAVIALTAMVAGPASAMVSQGDLRQDISSVAGADSNVFTNINGGVVTLSGYFGDAGSKHAALQAAKGSAGVERVIDLTSVSN